MITQTDYHGWNALSLNTGKVELVAPTDIGPRIIKCAPTGGENLFCNVPDQLGGKGEDEWKIRGGHRCWVAPEVDPRTYELDNHPVGHELLEGGKGFRLQGEVDAVSGLRKAVTVEVVDEVTFKVTHRVENIGNAWAVDCAPWALSVMAFGGVMAIPRVPYVSHEEDLLSGFSLVCWKYTDLSQPIWQFHHDFIGVDTTKAKIPQKLGLTNYPGWSAYWQEAGTFVTYTAVNPNGRYPDNGSCYEVFSCDFMCELETLGEMAPLEHGASVEHVEYWGVLDGLARPDSDEAFNDSLRPAVQSWLRDSVGKA